MIEARDFVDACAKRDFSLWSGVPCALLDPFIEYVTGSRNLDYVAATSAGEALEVAAGAALGGRGGVAICPNASLGDMVDPLTSLIFPYRLPLLLVVTQGGSQEPGDGPAQELMGRITGDLLSRLRVESEPFPEDAAAIEPALARAAESMENSGLPFAFVMQRALVEGPPRRERPRAARRVCEESGGSFEREPAQRMTRLEAIRAVREALTGEEAVIASTGGAGRELFALGHRSHQFYVAGSLGGAAAVGLGVARARRRRNVVVLDGDGAALMRLGTLATIGHHAPPRLTHVLLDNEAHEATGGQPSAAASIDLAAVAAACGYNNVWWTDDPAELAARIAESQKRKGPSFIHVKLRLGGDPAPGPLRLVPVQIKHQFMDFVQER
jgi:phosphonopyruvate decarboxylase